VPLEQPSDAALPTAGIVVRRHHRVKDSCECHDITRANRSPGLVRPPRIAVVILSRVLGRGDYHHPPPKGKADAPNRTMV
jgi:hypothetical protein